MTVLLLFSSKTVLLLFSPKRKRKKEGNYCFLQEWMGTIILSTGVIYSIDRIRQEAPEKKKRRGMKRKRKKEGNVSLVPKVLKRLPRHK
jgi:hypothetical protein